MTWETLSKRKEYGRVFSAVVSHRPSSATNQDWQWVLYAFRGGAQVADGRAETLEAAQTAADAWVHALLDEVRDVG